MGGGMGREREVSSVRAECVAPGSIEDGPWDAKRRRRRPERAPVVAPIFQIRPPLGRRSAKCDERSRAGQRRGAMVNASENRREAPRDPWRGPIEPCRAAIRPRVIRATRRGVETDTVGTAGIGPRPPRAFLLRTRTWWTGRDVDAGAALREATRLNARKGMGIQVGTVSCSSRGPDDASRAYRVMAAEAWSSQSLRSLGGKMLFQRHHVDRSSLSHHCHTVLMVAKLQSQKFTDLRVLFRARVCRNWLSNCVFGRSQICPPRRCEKNSRSELPLSPGVQPLRFLHVAPRYMPANDYCC